MKTPRLFFIIAIIALIIGGTACKGIGNKNTSSDDSTKVDTLWNAKVQDTFFDTKFGASREEVINNFAKHGFTLNKSISNDTWLVFDYNKSKYYTFGGIQWEILDVWLTDGKFSEIRFYAPQKDKAAVISRYEKIADELSKKYKLTNIEPEDTITYGIKKVFCKSGINSQIRCYRYESVGKEILYTAELRYGDTNIENKVSDEL